MASSRLPIPSNWASVKPFGIGSSILSQGPRKPRGPVTVGAQRLLWSAGWDSLSLGAKRSAKRRAR